MTRLFVLALLLPHQAADAITRRTRGGDDGQATAEYALVILGVAAIALAVVSWVTRSNLVGKLLDLVFGSLFRKIL